MSDQVQVTLTECPICSKKFPVTIIESHASKCLFLNESTSENKALSESFSTKGNYSPKQNFRTHKQNVVSTGQHYASDCEELKNKCQVTKQDSIPLAEKMRPTSLLSYVGQTHALGPQTMLYELLIKSEIPNIILWGPPGCGKTSLANVIANTCKYSPEKKHRYIKLSATMSGINEVKEAITIARNELKFGRQTIMFIDEIHRFNKIQQDTFLPHVESGTITLIGATTENPSYSLNPALLSRCKIIVLEKLTVEDLMLILEKAVEASEGSVNSCGQQYEVLKNTSIKFTVDRETIKWLAETSDGDARIALGGLELAIQSKIFNKNEIDTHAIISLNDVTECLKKTHMLYDRTGDQHYNIISALHKSVRASNENASLYWLTRMITGGEDPVYIARRLVRMASEDIGLADPKALGMAVNAMHACKMLGMPECDLILTQCTTYLARAPKSRQMEDALRAAQHLVSNYKNKQPAVPLHLQNPPSVIYNFVNKSGHKLHTNDSTFLPKEIEPVDFLN